MTIDEEALLNFFEVSEADDHATYMSNSDILSIIADEMKIRINQGSRKRLGMALAKYGFWRGKRDNRWVYAVKDKRSFPKWLNTDLTNTEDAA
jgi:hypothetical protein